MNVTGFLSYETLWHIKYVKLYTPPFGEVVTQSCSSRRRRFLNQRASELRDLRAELALWFHIPGWWGERWGGREGSALPKATSTDSGSTSVSLVSWQLAASYTPSPFWQLVINKISYFKELLPREWEERALIYSSGHPGWRVLLDQNFFCTWESPGQIFTTTPTSQQSPEPSRKPARWCGICFAWTIGLNVSRRTPLPEESGCEIMMKWAAH